MSQHPGPWDPAAVGPFGSPSRPEKELAGVMWADPPGVLGWCWRTHIGRAPSQGIFPWPSLGSAPELCEAERGSPACYEVPLPWRNCRHTLLEYRGILGERRSGRGGVPLVELHTHPSAAPLAIPVLGSTGPGQSIQDCSIPDSPALQLYRSYSTNTLSYPSWMRKQPRVPWEAAMPERGGQCCAVFFWQRKSPSDGRRCLGNLRSGGMSSEHDWR